MNKNKTPSKNTPVFCENCHHYQPRWVANKEDKKGFNAIPEKCLHLSNKLEEKQENVIDIESSHRLPPKKLKKRKKNFVCKESPMELNKDNNCSLYSKGFNTRKRTLVKNTFIIAGLIAILFTTLWLSASN